MQVFDVAMAFILANNLLFVHFLGIHDGLEGDRDLRSTLKRVAVMGLYLVVSSLFIYGLELVLSFLGWYWLRTLGYVGVLWALAEAYGQLRRTLSDLPPKNLLLFNSFLMGALLTMVPATSDLFTVIVFSLSSSVGYFLALVVLRLTSARLLRENVPIFFQGLPLQLFTCGLIALIFNGLSFSFTAGGR